MSVAVPRLADLARDGVPRHVVVCLFNAMGDAFLALPVIRFLIERFGRERVSVWAHEYHGRTVYAELGEVLVPSSECNRNVAAARKAAELAALRARLPAGCELSWVSLNPYAPRTDVEDHAIAALAPGALWEFRGTHLRVDAAGAPLHRMEQYFRVIGEPRAPAPERRPLLGAVETSRAAAIRDHVHRMSRRLVAVHAQTRANKCWPEARWRELGALLRDECELILLGLPGQALSRCGDYLTAPAQWHKQIALLAHADAFVGVDSCFSHVADAFGLPGVVLYSDAAMATFWRPIGPALEALIAADRRMESIAAAEVAGRLRQGSRRAAETKNRFLLSPTVSECAVSC